jgi:hypothetical protein
MQINYHSLFNKDETGQAACANNLLADGQNDNLRPAFGVAWYPTGTCIGYSPFTSSLDDDNNLVDSIKYTCNGMTSCASRLWFFFYYLKLFSNCGHAF